MGTKDEEDIMEPMLKPGEIRTAQVGGVTISVYSVAGGSFTHVRVRDFDGTQVEPAYTVMDETDALKWYRALVHKYSA